MENYSFRSLHKYAKIFLQEGVLHVIVNKDNEVFKNGNNYKDVSINYTRNGIVVEATKDSWVYNYHNPFTGPEIDVEDADPLYIETTYEMKRGNWFRKPSNKAIHKVKEGWVKLKKQDPATVKFETSNFLIKEHF